MATLTYVYGDSTAVVGPLATRAEPHCYDLCPGHAARLTAPRGWELVRHEDDPVLAQSRSVDDLEALANAVREAGRPGRARDGQAGGGSGLGGALGAGIPAGRRGHLRAVPTSS